MKRFLVLVLIFMCVICNASFAQITSPGKITQASTFGIRERLVELALQNPQLEISDHEINVAKYQLKAAKGWWAENFSFSFNANEYSLKNLGKPASSNAGYYAFYPLYNMAINIPIGGIFSKPQAVKAARERVAIAQAQRNSTYIQIKTAVLTAYENYLASKELLTLQSQATEGAYNEFLQAKEKFRNGQISLEDYNTASQGYHDQVVAKINAEHNFNLTKIQLEALIGVPLENALNNGSSATPPDSTRTP